MKMKNYQIYTLLLVGLIASCIGGKKIPLVDEEIIFFNEPYYQEIFPGQEDGQKRLLLTLPVQTFTTGNDFDSVYFHGFHVSLLRNVNQMKVEYSAKILVPKEKVEIIPPYPLTDSEALLSYTDIKGKKKLMKVENILRKEPIFQP